MSALDKFYDFTLNLPDAKLTSKAMSLCNIDRNVFNIYLTLQEGKNNPILNADLGNYTVTMIVVKPKTKEYVEKVGVVDGSNDRLLFELGEMFNDQIGSYKGEIKVQNGNEVITSSSFAYTVTQSLISGLNAEIEASPDVEILRQLINEVKAVVGMTPGDPDSLLTDYQKKNDNTLITTDKTIIGAINENSSQIKEKANLNEVRLSKIELNLNDFDEDTRAVLQGQEGNINAVLGARNVKSKNIELGSITPELIYGFKESINKYRRDLVVENKTIGSASDFILNDSQTTGVAIVPVKPSTTYSKGTMKGLLNQGVTYLDYEKKFISYNAGVSTFTTTSDCYYIAFNIDNANLNTYFVVEGNSIPTKYEPYYYEYTLPEEYKKEYNYKYKGNFSTLNEWYNARFISNSGKLHPNGANALLGYSVGYNIRDFVVQFKITPKTYSDGAGITVLAISNNSDVTKNSMENSIGVAFNPTSTSGNIIQGFNKSQRETLRWIDWTNSSDFTEQEYTVTIMKINHDISVNIISTNESTINNYGKIEYFYKVKDTSFDDLGIYVYSNDTRGENGLSINDMKYWCDLNFESVERTTFWGETDLSNLRIYLPPNYSYKNNYNAIMCFHGNGTDETQWSLNENMLYVKNELIESGYIILTCSYKDSKTTWGNKYSTQAYYEAYKYLINNFNNIDNIGIYCNSMGGIESLNFISENRVKPKCWVGTVPTYDLDANYSSESGSDFSGIIRSAYEIQSDGSDYKQKTNGRNPAKIPNFVFSGIPMLCIGSTGDVTVSPTDNIEKLYNDLYPVCNITKIMYEGGNHSNFDLSNNLNRIVDFYNNNINK